MDPNAGGGPSMASNYDLNMGNIGNMGPDDLQQHYPMDPNQMQFDLNDMHDMGLDFSAGYPSMMNGNGHDQRRQSQQKPSVQQMNQNVAMANFGQGQSSDLDGFQFDPTPMPPSMPAGLSPAGFASPAASAGMGTPNTTANGRPGIAQRRLEKQRAQRRASSGNLNLDTAFSAMNSGMGPMGQSSMQPMTATGVPMSVENPFYSMGGVNMMDFSMDQPRGMQNSMAMNMFQNQNMMPTMNPPMSQGMNQQMTSSASTPALPPSVERRQSYPPAQPQPQIPPQLARHNTEQAPKQQVPSDQSGTGNGDEQPQIDTQKIAQMTVSETQQHAQLMNQMQAVLSGRNTGMPMNTDQRHNLELGNFTHHQPPLRDNPNYVGYENGQQSNAYNFTTAAASAQEQYPQVGGQNVVPQFPNAYSATGFDMLNVLMRVATRPKPRINIGAVDMSCAFVVCDVETHDLPIIYCSEMFERLTGYSRDAILGRNCRFLQAPDGKVQSGVKRKYVDDRAVLHLKNMIADRQEAQISLINYRNGGQPFMNLLTMIPITWHNDEIKYYVGFQVDLVEQPTSITNKNPDGTYAINYQRGWLPKYVFNPGDSNRTKDPEVDRSVPSDEVTTVLSTLHTDSELSKRIWDKVLLENTDDVVHVLSLKGLFLYLSPSCKKTLEYDPHELVGTALSSVCHPSDIVPVTRELKDTSTGAAVSVIFRIRRKFSGYTWFEAHGALHNEQGKSKKCIILVGRARPVYALLRNDVVNGFGDSELWTKMSTTGMFLYVSQHVKSLLDRVPDELVGTSAQSLMRSESKVEFGKALELARCGYKHTFKHDVQNKRGQTLHAETTLYPGDAAEGTKATFIIGQTRLLKMGRGQPALVKQGSGQSDNSNSQRFMNSMASGSPATQNSVALSTKHSPQSLNGAMTPTGPGQQQDVNGVVTSAGGQGLDIGNQDELLAADDNVFDELKTTRSTSWQFELRQMEKRNRLLAEELQSLLSSRKKRKRRKGMGQLQKDCANCHTRNTPEWRRGPSGQRDLCNSCGLRWAKTVCCVCVV